MGALFVMSPVTTGIITGLNLAIRKGSPEELKGIKRRGLVMAANTLLCAAAGAMSTFYGVLPAAVAAAGIYTWIFGGDKKKEHEERQQEQVHEGARKSPFSGQTVIDVEAWEMSACTEVVKRRKRR